MPPTTATVTMGRVTRRALITASPRKPKFWGQMFRRRAGHGLFVPRGFSKPRNRTMLLRWSHSPGPGRGHMAHQERAPMGTRMVMSRNHHRIQMRTMAAFTLPRGWPRIPASMST